MIAFIWAEDKNHLIGKNGTLPWHLPADMHNFAKVTANSTVVMGRRTFESFPHGALPHRRNIVLTHRTNFNESNTEVAHSHDEVLNLIKTDPKVFILGGSVVFKEFMDDADYLYETKIDHEFDGDAKMAPIDYNKFELISKKTGIVDDKNPWNYEFLIYKRKL